MDFVAGCKIAYNPVWIFFLIERRYKKLEDYNCKYKLTHHFQVFECHKIMFIQAQWLGHQYFVESM